MCWLFPPHEKKSFQDGQPICLKSRLLPVLLFRIVLSFQSGKDKTEASKLVVMRQGGKRPTANPTTNQPSTKKAKEYFYKCSMQILVKMDQDKNIVKNRLFIFVLGDLVSNVTFLFDSFPFVKSTISLSVSIYNKPLTLTTSDTSTNTGLHFLGRFVGRNSMS